MPESDRPQHSCIPQPIGCISMMFFIMFIVQGIVGFVRINDCRRAPFIPIYMFLCGLIIVFSVLSCLKNWCNVFCCFGSIGFYVAWFIAGSIIIYSIYEPNYNKNATETDRYCNQTLYPFAFWTTTLTYILSGVLLSFSSFALCNMQTHSDGSETQPLLRV